MGCHVCLVELVKDKDFAMCLVNGTFQMYIKLKQSNSGIMSTNLLKWCGA